MLKPSILKVAKLCHTLKTEKPRNCKETSKQFDEKFTNPLKSLKVQTKKYSRLNKLLTIVSGCQRLLFMVELIMFITESHAAI